MKYELLVPDISCGHCRNKISRALEELGVKNYQIDVQTKKVIVEAQNIEPITRKLEQIGYPVESFKQI